MKSWYTRLSVALPRPAIIAHDLFMVWLCWSALHWIRYALMTNPPPHSWWSVETIIVLVAQGLVFWKIGLYRGLWRFASVPDLGNIFKAGLIGLLAIVMGLAIYNRIETTPRTVLLLYPFALTCFLGLPRLLYRTWKDGQARRAVESATKRILILGAGRAADALLRDLRRSGAWEPVGLLDDAKTLQGTKLRGIPVLGALSDAPAISKETDAGLLVIAMPSLNAEQMQRVVSICESANIPFRTVPRLVDILEGRALPGELKEVAIEDLLGRQPVTPDWQMIRSWLGGRTVLVTGAGGSIGSELCRQCARHGARRIALMEISEWALIQSHQSLVRAFPDIEVIPFLGNCGDPAAIEHALDRVKPDAVFHAAAYKHVPLLEGQLREAIRNNVLATDTIARACREEKVGTFVFISTDKAVDPVNVLGASKRMAEMACQSQDDHGTTRFTTVRFGNVLDSAGSVVPLFREQIRLGGPVTVTHPDVTRYFMTIPEACQLIIQAAASATHASIYTLDMGEPIPIRVLAEQMIRLTGKQSGRDIAITYTGLRPGEKMHETLFHSEELYRPTIHPKILEARARALSPDVVTQALQQLRQAVYEYDDDKMWHVLHETIPEFCPVSHSDVTNSVVQFPTREVKKHS